MNKKSKNIEETDRKLRALCSLNQEEYDQLLQVFVPLAEEKLRFYTLKEVFRQRPVYQEMSNSLLGSQLTFEY